MSKEIKWEYTYVHSANPGLYISVIFPDYDAGVVLEVAYGFDLTEPPPWAEVVKELRRVVGADPLSRSFYQKALINDIIEFGLVEEEE